MKYHIKITDNETGKVIEDADFSCMFGAIGFEDETAQVALADEVSNLNVACALVAANKVVEKVVNDGGVYMKMLIKVMMKGEAEHHE